MSRMILGRTAVVSGAGNGLGRAISLALSHHGAQVVLMGRDQGKLEMVANEVRDGGGSAAVATCDVSVPESVAAAANSLADEDVSILINNAGVGGPVASLVDIEPQQWDDVFDVNVRGVYLMCRAFLPGMIARGSGDIINVASVAGKRPLPGRTPYAASKAAVIALSMTLGHEVGPLGVTVNSLSPGPVDGPRMTRNFALEAQRRGITPEGAEAEYVSKSALHRMITEEEVGDAVAAMLHMTGLCAADIDLTAGMVAR